MSFRDFRVRGLGGVLLVSVALTTSAARAQTDEQRSGARAAATAGGQAYSDRKWAEAVDLFTRAESLVHSPVHLLYLARSYEKLGALVKAREAYIRITNEELASNATAPMKQAKAEAAKELEVLEPRVPYVSVDVQGAGPKPIAVTMDGEPVPAALLGVPRPVDPGEHRFEATAEGMDSAVSSISVREARNETVVLTLHQSTTPVAVAPAPAQTPAPVGYSPQITGPVGGPVADAGGGPSPLAWVALGVGAVGLGVGTIFAIKETNKVRAADDECHLAGPGGNDYCSSKASSLDDDARSARTISIVGFAVGGVGVVTGATLLVISAQHKAAVKAASFTPWVGLGSAGVRGRF